MYVHFLDIQKGEHVYFGEIEDSIIKNLLFLGVQLGFSQILWLFQKVIRTISLTSLFILLAGIIRQHNDYGSRLVLFNLLENIKSVFSWHADVENRTYCMGFRLFILAALLTT